MRISGVSVASVGCVLMLLVITTTKVTEASLYSDMEGSAIDEDTDDIYSGSGSGSGSGDGLIFLPYEKKTSAPVLQVFSSPTPSGLQSTSKVSFTTSSSEVTTEATVVYIKPAPRHNTKPPVEILVTEHTTMLPPSTMLPVIVPDSSEETVTAFAPYVSAILSRASTTAPDHSLTTTSNIGADIAINSRELFSSIVPKTTSVSEVTSVDDNVKGKVDLIEKETGNEIEKNEPEIYFPNERKIVQKQETPVGANSDANKMSEMSNSKSFLERGEIVAAVVAGGAVGLILAVLLVVLLVYRMKKKDEGTYTLEETKQPNGGYQKPVKQEEFYA
uniref:Neurexin/syndecan/glycophorin C domain-containing protein n=1 Tax=Callorhinchus milii TaxID=7868 RepID=A0A4W3JCF3_CALMI|eukprot:gi/632977151/ref/XP_007905186.1/ PREDICTED: syndecan-1 [Callorhinchus milii]